MPKRFTPILIVGAILVLVIAFIVLRPGDDDEPAPIPTTAEQSATEPATTAPSDAAETATTRTQPAKPRPAQPAARRIRVRNGQPVGGPVTITVESGDRVRLVVTADAPEEVHLHGYDVSREVGPDQTARFDLRANAEGVFEIELENSAVKIAELRVEPR